MEMALNNTNFSELSYNEMLEIDGGRNWLATIAGTVAGVATIVVGVCVLLTPEPTGLTKVAGWATIVAGVATIAWAWS